jgi:hypothetical protein
MYSKFAAAFAGAILLAAGAAQAADVPSDAAAVLAADYKLGCTAALDPSDANLDAAFANMAPDFVNIDVKGKTHARDEVVANQKQVLKQIHTTSCDTTFDSQTLNADGTITIVATGHVEGTIQTPDGTHNLVATSKSSDTWKQIDGKWLQTQGKDLRNLVKIDGQVVQDEGE